MFGEHQDIVISFLNALQSFSSSRREAMEKGFNEGFDKRDGKRYNHRQQEERIKNARNLKRLRTPVETIAKATGLVVDDIADL